MQAEIHSLSWPNADPRLAEHQAAVFRHFSLPIQQHCAHHDHGSWMDEILTHSQADVVLFVDNDCVPLSRAAVIEAIQFAIQHQSFLGVAQSSNHLNNGSHIFAAPAFLAIWRRCWDELGRPSCRPTQRSDVAEELSWRAEEQGRAYRAWYPGFYHHPSHEGLWRLGNYGHYGIGTVFAGRVFHLFQGRFAQNVDLFVHICNAILKDAFSTAGMLSCLDDPGAAQG